MIMAKDKWSQLETVNNTDNSNNNNDLSIDPTKVVLPC